MIINQSAINASLASAKEIFGPERFISAEETWQKLNIPLISSMTAESYVDAFNRLRLPFTEKELFDRKDYAYFIPVHKFSLIDLQRLLHHDHSIAIEYKNDDIREQLARVEPAQISWKIVDEDCGLTKKIKTVKPKFTTLLQAALIIFKAREKNILAKGSLCKDSIKFGFGKKFHPFVRAAMQNSIYEVNSFLNMSNILDPKFVLSID